MNQLPSAGKHEPEAKRRKTSTGCQARENINQMLSVGKKYTLLCANIGTGDVQINS